MKYNEPSEQNESQERVENFFRENFESIHPPAQLKEDTLRKMLEKHEKLQAQETRQTAQDTRQTAEEKSGGGIIFFRQSGRLSRFSALAAVFALIIVGTLFFSNPNVTVTSIQAEGLISDYGTMYRAEGDIRVEETENTALSVDVAETLCDFYLMERHSYAVSDADGRLLDEILQLSYAKGNKTLTVVYSVGQMLAPATLYTTQPQIVSGIPVFLGKNSTDKTFYAAWSTEKYLVAARMYNCSRRTAMDLLEAVLEKP